MIFFEKVELFNEGTHKFKKYIYEHCITVPREFFQGCSSNLNMCLTSNKLIRIRSNYVAGPSVGMRVS